jgi:hypothetical protein
VTLISHDDSAEKPRNASTKLSMNGKPPIVSTAPPFVLRLSKDEGVFFSGIASSYKDT